MANHTIELRDIIEHGHDIFNFNYEFYDETKRRKFEEDFIKHFYFREICHPVIDRFIFYLEDKMNTVFPFYNELFKTAMIEYDKVYNYDMTETYEKLTENANNQSGVSSTVSQLFDEQNSTSTQNRTVDSTGTTKTKGSDVLSETGKENVETTSENNVSGDKEFNSEKLNKYLDTPQGLTDISNSNYVTNVTFDREERTENSDENSSGSSETEKTSTRNVSNSNNAENNSTGRETTADEMEVISSQEQRGTNDNNTRIHSNTEQKENYKLTRIGNIGVQTASDMLEKHIDLQKKLKKIEMMFFDECEDLFMLVY